MNGLMRNSRIRRRRRTNRQMVRARARDRRSGIWNPWILILDRAVERDLDLRPHRILDLKSYRLGDRAGTLLLACLRSSSPARERRRGSA